MRGASRDTFYFNYLSFFRYFNFFFVVIASCRRNVKRCRAWNVVERGTLNVERCRTSVNVERHQTLNIVECRISYLERRRTSNVVESRTSSNVEHRRTSNLIPRTSSNIVVRRTSLNVERYRTSNVSLSYISIQRSIFKPKRYFRRDFIGKDYCIQNKKLILAARYFGDKFEILQNENLFSRHSPDYEGITVFKQETHISSLVSLP